MPLPTLVEYKGSLQIKGPMAYLVAPDAEGVSSWTLMMLDNSPTGQFDWSRVVAARNHFGSLPNGTQISVIGFVTQEDTDGTGGSQYVLHVVRDGGAQ